MRANDRRLSIKQAAKILETCNKIIQEIGSGRPSGSLAVNWKKVGCYDVMVSAISPKEPPILFIGGASPDANEFGKMVEREMLKQSFIVRVRCEW